MVPRLPEELPFSLILTADWVRRPPRAGSRRKLNRWKASTAILALKPVTFRYRQEIDPKGIPQFGLVAEEVEKVNPDLVVRDAEGKVSTVSYEAVNAMLLNEFLKEHRKVEEMEKAMALFSAQLKEQAEQIQKVSAQLEASKPAPQVVNNNQ